MGSLQGEFRIMKLLISILISLTVFKSSDGMNKKGFFGKNEQRMQEIYKNIIGALQNISIPLLTISESLIESNEKEIQKVMDENTRSGCDWSGLKKWSCCSITNQCGENEGDCDSDAHCSNNLKCGTENCVGPHFHPLADCCFSAVAPDPPQAELPFEDSEEENKEKRNFYYHPTYAQSYKTKKPYTSYYTKSTTTMEPPTKCTTSKTVRFCEHESHSVLPTPTTDCVFPFTFDGNTYDGCTKDGTVPYAPYSWCASEVDGGGNILKTGICDPDCPGVGAVCDWSGSKKWSCCSASNQCGAGEGDCDEDEDCAGALKCGSNNCFTDDGPGALFSSAADCCYDSNPKSCKCPPGEGIDGICAECPPGFGLDADGICGLCKSLPVRPMRPEINLAVRPTRPSGSANGRPTRPAGSDGERPAQPSESDGGRPARPSESDGGRPSRPNDQPSRVKRQAFGLRPARPSGSDDGRPSRPPSSSGRPTRPTPGVGKIPSDNKCSACSNVPTIDLVTGVCNPVITGLSGGRPSRPPGSTGRPTRPSNDDYHNDYEEY